MIKKFVFCMLFLSCLFSCSTDLSDIENRLNQLEQEGRNLKNKGDQLAKEGDQLKDDINKSQNQLNNFADNQDEPQLLSFEFLSSDNPMQLVEDTRCEILEGNIVECRVLNMMSSKSLVPRFQFKGESLTLNGQKAESGVTSVDFSKPVTLTVTGMQKSVSYTVNVYAYTGLPVLTIETASRADIDKPNWNFTASLKLVEDIKTRAAGDVLKSIVKIKGLAPIETYYSKVYTDPQIAKNNYVISFEDFTSVLGMQRENDWELVSNSKDRSMIRNKTAFYMSGLSKLDFTPEFKYVELILNGIYYGTYMLGERVEASSSRVNVGFDGYLLKVDETTTGLNMKQQYLESPVSILSPSTMTGEPEYVYIREFMNDAEDALFSPAFTTSVGWQKYFDTESFVDWYLINEIVKNEDAVFKSNCYMHMKKGEKLKMGPVWDFKNAFGTNTDTNGFVVKKSKWFDRLFQDPAFVEKVKERYTFFYSHKRDIISEMNNLAVYLKYSVQENNNKWELYDLSGTTVSSWVLYQSEIDTMKNWLSKRMDWLNSALSEL